MQSRVDTCERFNDGKKNGNENDVDCGGSCTDCATGQDCTVADDCESGVCAAGDVCM
jgi:hypothetical protein